MYARLSAVMFRNVLFLCFCASCFLASCQVETRSVPKYVFYFIGDGMGQAQLDLAEAVSGNEAVRDIVSLPITGMVRTSAADRYITGSAAAGTALATGVAGVTGRISRNTGGDDLETILDVAAENGLKTGIVSNVSLDHATPACFFAHADHRSQYEQIALQMTDAPVHYYGGGYLLADLDGEGFPLGEYPRKLSDGGFTVVSLADEVEYPSGIQRSWVYGRYDRKGSLAYEIDRVRHEQGLADFTRLGIRLLDNPEGFFLVVEGGKIDWACHANDGGTAVHEIRAFNDAVAEALAFYRQHPDETLIIVTADHECGGLSLGNNDAGYDTDPSLLGFQRSSFERLDAAVRRWISDHRLSFPSALDSLRVLTGLGDTSLHASLVLTAADSLRLEAAYREEQGKPDEGYRDGDTSFGREALLLLQRKAGISWGTRHHTAVDVPVFASGPGAELFSGRYATSELPLKIMKLCGWDD